MNNIYKIILVSVAVEGEEEFPTFEQYKENYPSTTFEQYNEIKSACLDGKEEFYAEDVAYSSEFKTLHDMLSYNVGDISDNGRFSYGVIVKCELDTIYPDKNAVVSGCYRYESKKDSFIKIHHNADKYITALTADMHIE